MSKKSLAWRRVSRGLCWMTWGVFLLLTTLDVLSWSFWGSLLAYWPVLLVMLGLRLIFERSTMPWAVLLSPLLLAATMSYVAFAQPRVPRGPTQRIHASRPAEAREFRVDGSLASLDLNLRAAPLPAGSLLAGEATSGRRGTSLSLIGDERAPRLRLRSPRFHGVVFPLGGASWSGELTADLADDLPVQLDLDMAMVEGTIDLAAGIAERVEIEGAFQDLLLRLPETDEDVSVHLHGAFNRLQVEVPSWTPVRTSTDGFIVFVDGREDAARLGGPGYRLHVEGAFTWVGVQSYEPLPRRRPEPPPPAGEEAAETAPG